eukprot:gene2281-8554_t
MADRTELRSILMRLLRRNSMAALELHVVHDGAGKEVDGASPSKGHETEEADVVAKRTDNQAVQHGEAGSKEVDGASPSKCHETEEADGGGQEDRHTQAHQLTQSAPAHPPGRHTQVHPLKRHTEAHPGQPGPARRNPGTPMQTQAHPRAPGTPMCNRRAQCTPMHTQAPTRSTQDAKATPRSGHPGTARRSEGNTGHARPSARGGAGVSPPAGHTGTPRSHPGHTRNSQRPMHNPGTPVSPAHGQQCLSSVWACPPTQESSKRMGNMPIFGVGMPTYEGITQVLKNMSASISPNAPKRMGNMPIFGVGMPTYEGHIQVLKNVSGSTSPNASKRMGNMPIFGVGMPTNEGIIQVQKNVSGSTSPNASKRMGNMPIFGVGMPTYEGIIQVLKNVSGSTSPNASKRMGNMPIFGVGMPTYEGIIQVLKNVSGSTSPNASKRVHALWINMREEPVVYINGRPFVLREEVRPLKNMMEYAGIVAARLESMEERLKKDVLSECGGRILVACESFVEGHNGELNDQWEEIDHPDAVLTPAEVYASLTKQGFAVNYARIPVTDGTAPVLDDIDALVDSVMGFGLENPVIFNCQMGIGRATTGMVMGGMMYMYSEGALEATRQALGNVDLVAPSELNVSGNDLESSPDRAYLTMKRMTETQALGNVELGAGMDDDGFGIPTSPRMSDDEEDDDANEPKIWEVDTAEIREEQKALAGGGYVGVRRIVRLLEEGENAKKTVDAMVDTASGLINLRKAIMRYCKPRMSYKYVRPELQQFTSAFNTSDLRQWAFVEWVGTRPDLQLAFASIKENPSASLAPVPISKVTAIYQPEGEDDLSLEEQRLVLAKRRGCALPEGEGDLSLDEQRRVLAKRRGRTLTRRTILKSYLSNNMGEIPTLAANVRHDLIQVEGMPIYSVAQSTQLAIKSAYLIQFERMLRGYVNGTPHIRRELEMPAAALHHAGIHAPQLEELEQLMKEDVTDEVGKWGGRILLHRELPVCSLGGAKPEAPPAAAPKATQGGLSRLLQQEDVTALSEPDPYNAVLSYWAEVDTDQDSSLTTPRECCPAYNAVLSYWAEVDTDQDSSLTTLRELVQDLVQKGYNVSYCRVPLSRDRTPEPTDLAQLHAQLLNLDSNQKVAHLILSRRSTGSSARFAAAAFTLCNMQPEQSAVGGATISGGPSLDPSAGEFRGIMFAAAAFTLCNMQPEQSAVGGATVSGGPGLDPSAGEFRGIMSLCRLLPGGSVAKLMVDTAINKCTQIGNILSDIRK